MNKSLIKLLCCPKCKGELSNKIKNIKCLKCGSVYLKKEGVIILIDTANLPIHLSNQIKYFEKERAMISAEYKLEEWQKSYIDRFVKAYPKLDKRVLFDCGAGTGYMCIELAKRGAFVIALDLTVKSLIKLSNIANKFKLKDKIIFICASAENIPIKNNVVDYVSANAILEHIPNEKNSIAEIGRIAKRNAGMMLSVPLSYRYLNPIITPIAFFYDKRIGHLRRYNKEIIEKKFIKWKIMKLYYTGHINKAIKIIINLIFRREVFNEHKLEIEDNKYVNSKWGANNIITLMNKN